MIPSQQTQNAVDVAQASELTGLSKKAIRRRLERGTLNSIKVGGRRMIPVSELLQHGLLDTSGAAEAPPAAQSAAPAPRTVPTSPIAAPTRQVPQAAPQAPPAPDPALTPRVAPPPPQTPTAPQTAAPPPAASQPPVATPEPAPAPQAAVAPPTPVAPQATPPPTLEAATSQVVYAPPEGGAPAYPPGQTVPVQGELPYYPPRGASYYWYKYPALRWLAVILAIAVVALLVWLLAIRSDGNESTAVIQPGGGPVGATEADLVTLSQRLGQPVYWAGTMPDTRLEITESNNSYAYLRYLTQDSPVGDPSPDFLTVGTYPSPGAYTNLRSYAENKRADTTRIQNGGLAVTVPGSPTSVYFAYPNEDVQVEVYDPEPGHAMELVKSGVVRPVTTSTNTTTVPATPTTPQGSPTVVPQG
jgi:excisionase family DNA binding protein